MRPHELTSRGVVPWLRVSAAVTAAGILGLAAPLLWSLLKAGASLLALGTLSLLTLACLQALPYLAERLERHLLAARLREAQLHPLEQLQSELLQRSDQVVRYRNALASIYAQIEGMREMLEDRRRSEPQHDLARQRAALDKMVAFHTAHLRKLDAAEAALFDFKRYLASKRFEWNFAEAGQRALESLVDDDRETLVRELLCDEATRAIQLDFQRVFAELDRELHTLPGSTR